MFTGYFISPVKGKFNSIKAYAVVRGYGKAREEAILFEVTIDRSVEAAFEAATDTATLLNNSI